MARFSTKARSTTYIRREGVAAWRKCLCQRKQPPAPNILSTRLSIIGGGGGGGLSPGMRKMKMGQTGALLFGNCAKGESYVMEGEREKALYGVVESSFYSLAIVQEGFTRGKEERGSSQNARPKLAWFS